MTTRPENSKLVELRSKTDRQLAELLTRKLDRAARLIAMGELSGPAEHICEDVRRLLPIVLRADRRRFEARLQQIAEMLPAGAQAACF